MQNVAFQPASCVPLAAHAPRLWQPQFFPAIIELRLGEHHGARWGGVSSEQHSGHGEELQFAIGAVKGKYRLSGCRKGVWLHSFLRCLASTCMRDTVVGTWFLAPNEVMFKLKPLVWYLKQLPQHFVFESIFISTGQSRQSNIWAHGLY